jgi:hypothetical protein
MTDRFKGFLVTLEKDVRSDDPKIIQNALAMIKGVSSVKPYISSMEDDMKYEKAKSDIGNKLLGFVRKECFNIND